MITIRTIFLFLHILSAGLWISGAVVQFVLGRMVQSNEGKPAEVNYMLAQFGAMGMLGQIGGPGILITGLGLIGADHFGFLGIGGTLTPTWLVIKQVIYIILLGLTFAVIVPTSARLTKQLQAAAQNVSVVTPEMHALSARIVNVGNIHHLLVLVNIFLAVWKQPL